MPTARQLASAAVLALLGSLLLSGCRSAPGVAAYVGNVRITTGQLDAAMDKIRADVTGLDPDKPADTFGDVRRELLADLIFTQVGKRYASEHDYPEPTVDYAAVAGATRLPDNDPLVRARSEANAYQTLIESKISIGEPAEADLREVYDRVLAYGQQNKLDVVQGRSFEDFKPAIQAATTVTRGIAVRNALRASIAGFAIVLNPRYLPVEYVVASVPITGNPPFRAVVLSFGASSVPVISD
jgi:outer membrane murein-binding lipoprotein Lpp